MINWDSTVSDSEKIDKILERAKALFPSFNPMSMSMDITATHLNGCELDLDMLLNSDVSRFKHDILGIARHIDRSNGQLQDGFIPKCSKKD